MDLERIPILDMLRTRMAWLNARQTVLADNVANANTPGYQAKDMAPIDFEALLRSSGTRESTIAATDPRHIGGASPGGFAFQELPDSESAPNGNSVVLEEQMIKVAETQMEYSAATNLYKKALGLIRIAVGGLR